MQEEARVEVAAKGTTAALQTGSGGADNTPPLPALGSVAGSAAIAAPLAPLAPAAAGGAGLPAWMLTEAPLLDPCARAQESLREHNNSSQRGSEALSGTLQPQGNEDVQQTDYAQENKEENEEQEKDMVQKDQPVTLDQRLTKAVELLEEGLGALALPESFQPRLKMATAVRELKNICGQLRLNDAAHDGAGAAAAAIAAENLSRRSLGGAADRHARARPSLPPVEGEELRDMPPRCRGVAWEEEGGTGDGPPPRPCGAQGSAREAGGTGPLRSAGESGLDGGVVGCSPTAELRGIEDLSSDKHSLARQSLCGKEHSTTNNKSDVTPQHHQQQLAANDSGAFVPYYTRLHDDEEDIFSSAKRKPSQLSSILGTKYSELLGLGSTASGRPPRPGGEMAFAGSTEGNTNHHHHQQQPEKPLFGSSPSTVDRGNQQRPIPQQSIFDIS